MKIGELAQISGSSPRQIRHYEAAGLLCSLRLPNGYREFQDSDAAGCAISGLCSTTV
ncbi:MerR family DNA-binding transcriptional regulator [Streptomyces sp. PB17]|uniref:MerR family DNA-binding transcriptional regulator n=1 Tax=Streptomyces sp. PB17 TaxID=3384158 RepID=UPI0038B5EBB8